RTSTRALRSGQARQLQPEASPDPLAAGADAELATQELRPARREGQPESDTAGLHIGIVPAAERTEDRATLAFGDPRSAIFHLDREPAVFRHRPQHDPRVGRVPRVFLGVVDQVADDLFDQAAISDYACAIRQSVLDDQILAGRGTAFVPVAVELIQ